MDLEKQLKEIEALGNNHVGTLVDTPIREDAFDMSNIEKIALIKKDVRNIMHTLGLDLTDDSLKGTPTRVAKMFVEEIFGGLHPDRKPKASTFDNKYKYGEMLVEKNHPVFDLRASPAPNSRQSPLLRIFRMERWSVCPK